MNRTFGGTPEPGNAEEANHWRRSEFFIESIIRELEMWIAIHNNKVSAAWDAFCDAEGYAECVAAWLPDWPLGRERVRHLIEVERIVFPHQPWFTSSGFVIEKETCTICGSDYGVCEHLAGEIYSGIVARRKSGAIKEVLHIAVVKDPSDKRCRIMSVAGGLDPLTGEPSGSSKVTPRPHPKTRRPKSKRKKRK